MRVTQRNQILVYFMDEWKALYDSKSGERGIFNRESAVKMAERMVVGIQKTMISVQILVLRLFYVIVSSVIFQRL